MIYPLQKAFRLTNYTINQTTISFLFFKQCCSFCYNHSSQRPSKHVLYYRELTLRVLSIVQHCPLENSSQIIQGVSVSLQLLEKPQLSNARETFDNFTLHWISFEQYAWYNKRSTKCNLRDSLYKVSFPWKGVYMAVNGAYAQIFKK